jgi:hypothetical protein
VTIVDVDDVSLLDEARNWFGQTPLESKTPKGHHLWYRSNGEPRRIRPLGNDVGIDVLGSNGYAIVPASEGYSFVKGGLHEVPNLPALNSDVLPAISPSPAMVPASLVERLPEMGEDSGRNTTLFSMARSLAQGATSRESLLEDVTMANLTFGVPLPPQEVEAVTNSVWRYKEEGRLLAKGQPSFLVRKDAHDLLLGNCEAMSLYHDLLRNHSMRKHDEFILANETRKRLGISQHRFVAAVNYLADKGLLQITQKGGRGPGSVRKVRLLAI